MRPSAFALERSLAREQQLAEPVKSIVLGAFTNALDDVFLVGVPFVALAVVVALLLKEKPLRTG